MNDADFLAQCMRYQDGVLSTEETSMLECAMRADPAKRRLFAETQCHAMALHDRFRQEAFHSGADFNSPMEQRRSTGIGRPIAAMAAGLVIGLFCASIVWAIALPKATTERLFSLLNGNFDESHIASGFPREFGLWSGDEAAIANGRLCFNRPGSDSSDPGARAISCDVFQLVDLRPLRHTLSQTGDSVLELGANVCDARPYNTNPSVTFFCQLYLFQGDSAALHERWPQCIANTLASGSAQVTTLGNESATWRSITAKCLVSADADFAVVQISARPNLRPAKLEGLFADDVKLSLKTQPALPVRTILR